FGGQAFGEAGAPAVVPVLGVADVGACAEVRGAPGVGEGGEFGEQGGVVEPAVRDRGGAAAGFADVGVVVVLDEVRDREQRSFVAIGGVFGCRWWWISEPAGQPRLLVVLVVLELADAFMELIEDATVG